MDKTITITRDEYFMLKMCEISLTRLENGGVDN